MKLKLAIMCTIAPALLIQLFNRLRGALRGYSREAGEYLKQSGFEPC